MKQQIQIGFGTEHGEICNPENPEFALFFHMFSRFPVEVQRVRYTKEALESIDALLVGCPLQELSTEECAAIRTWVQNGGFLLLLSTMGGDRAVGCDRHYRSNLSALTGGISFSDTAVGRMQGHTRFLSQCLLDTSSVLPHHPRSTYIDGCALKIEQNNVNIIAKHALPLQTQALCNFRIHERHTHIRPQRQRGYAMVAIQQGKGRISCFGAVETLSRKGLKQKGNRGFLFYLLTQWIPTLIETELHRRMSLPQRHRLLHAYPMAPLMLYSSTPTHSRQLEDISYSRDIDRRLLLGILPHPYCNPMVKGCGFCTFPHEQYTKKSAISVAKTVLREIKERIKAIPSLTKSPVDAIYFGGATANLTPYEDFEAILSTIFENFQCSNAEVTLEGAPIYFLKGDGAKLLKLLSTTTQRGRISMGVQTFSQHRLKQMGRQGYGSKEDIQNIVQKAHSNGVQTSCDLLIDLPHQSIEEIIHDIQTAIHIGFDQICIYHLVLYKELGTEWAKDPHMLHGLPSNKEASERWDQICTFMRENHFIQTTLTNFERTEVIESGKNFQYEALEMNLLDHDFIGFGPAGITRIAHKNLLSGHKILNPSESHAYLQKMDETTNGIPGTAAFSYDARDMQILFLTRHIGRAKIDKSKFQEYYGHTIHEAFPLIFPVLASKPFLTSNGTITPLGNSYADSIAGILAWPKVIEQEIQDKLKGYTPPSEETYYNESRRHWMG